MPLFYTILSGIDLGSFDSLCVCQMVSGGVAHALYKWNRLSLPLFASRTSSFFGRIAIGCLAVVEYEGIGIIG